MATEAQDTALFWALYATGGREGRRIGDHVIDEVTEGRKRSSVGAPWPYSSCGDLVSYVWARMGVRHHDWINRVEVRGEWTVGLNLIRAAKCPAMVQFSGQALLPGDAVITGNHPRGYDQHIQIVESTTETTVTTLDYGQSSMRGAEFGHVDCRRNVRQLVGSGELLAFGGRYGPARRVQRVARIEDVLAAAVDTGTLVEESPRP